MKKIIFYPTLVLIATISTAFAPNPITPADLSGTKWISPINDNCFDSLCFTSENTVMYYRCDHNLYAEIGYKVHGDKIEIEAFGQASMEPESKLIVTIDNGVLKQYPGQNNNFPKNFIVVPDGVCN